MLYNVYCDETCHLEHDGINDMIIGAIWCPQNELREINNRIKEIKIRNGISQTSELKWTKISPSQIGVYKDLINYFFDNNDLHFRAIIIPDKSKLKHEMFQQTHIKCILICSKRFCLQLTDMKYTLTLKILILTRCHKN